MNDVEKNELHRIAMKRADEAHEADFYNREEALDDLRFRAAKGHDQWPIDVQQERIADGRPMFTINLTGKFIRQVSNDARQNRPSIKVRGVDDESDPETADVFEGLVRHIEDKSEAVSTAYIPAIENAATCGIGHWRIKTDYADEDSFSQEICIAGIPNALAVLWDPLAKAMTREDARYCFVIEDMAEEEFEAKYPHAVKTGFEHADFWCDQSVKKIRVAEYWCKEPVDRTIGRTQDGKVIDLTKIPAPSVKFLGITETRKVKSHKIVQYILSGAEILEGPNDFPGKHIPIVAVIGEEIHVGEERVRHGLMRFLKIPQFLYNLWRTLQAETIAMQPKAPFMAANGQIAKYRDVWLQANKRNLPFLPYDPLPGVPPPQRSIPPQASAAMTEEAMLSVEEMKGTTGIYDAALGNKSNKGQSGVAISNLQHESDTSNSHFPDNLALSIRHTGRILVDIIPEVLDTEMVVRLLNEDGTEKWDHINKLIQTPDGPQYLHDLSVGKYDVTVKTGPSYATKRQESADFLMQFMQTMPDYAAFAADILAKNLDAPGSEELARRLRIAIAKQHPEFFPEGTGEPPTPPTPADQNNALMAHAQLTKLVAEAQLAEANAEDAEMDAALKGLQVSQAAAQGPMEAAAEQAVMNVLQRLLGGQQQNEQPGQNGAGIPPAPPSQPAAPMMAQ